MEHSNGEHTMRIAIVWLALWVMLLAHSTVHGAHSPHAWPECLPRTWGEVERPRQQTTDLGFLYQPGKTAPTEDDEACALLCDALDLRYLVHDRDESPLLAAVKMACRRIQEKTD